MANIEYSKKFTAMVEKEYADSPDVLRALHAPDHEQLGVYLMLGHQSVALKLEDAALYLGQRKTRGIVGLYRRFCKWGCRLDFRRQWERASRRP